MKNACRYCYALLVMMPFVATGAEPGFSIEAGTASVRADSHQTGDPVAPFTPKFSDTAPTVAIAANVRLGAVPLRVSLFKVQVVEGFVSFVSSDSGAGFAFDTDLKTHGVTISVNPSWQLADEWIADAGIGMLYLRQEVDARSSYLSFHRTDTTLTAIGSAGLSFRFAPNFSSRLGLELAKDYASIIIGLKVDL